MTFKTGAIEKSNYWGILPKISMILGNCKVHMDTMAYMDLMKKAGLAIMARLKVIVDVGE